MKLHPSIVLYKDTRNDVTVATVKGKAVPLEDVEEISESLWVVTLTKAPARRTPRDSEWLWV